MCVANGSIDLVTSVCPMCKVFKPTGPRCPHKRDICRNKANHPRHDVVHLTNAEVQSFNGCGYCKWAQSDPPLSKTGMHNPGWPGCCRPPLQSELSFVQPADWPAVSIVHRTPIPPDIKALLDKVMGPTTNGQPSAINCNTGAPRAISSNSATTSPTSERKKRGVFSTSSNPVSRSPSMSIPQKAQKGGSPQLRPSSLTTSTSRAPTNGSPGAASGNSPSIEATTPTQGRRPGPADTPVKRVEGFRTTPPANTRKLVEADGTMTVHHTPITRPSLANVSQQSSPSVSTLADVAQRPLKRRASLSSNTFTPQATRVPKSSSKSTSSSNPSKLDSASLETSLKALSVSSKSGKDNMSQTGSSDGSSSRGDTSTITSEGFTDYLSDESEAELQRMAEQRAVIAEQHRMEEEEFKAARQQLAPIGLQPPQVWTTGLPSRA
ncbi:hypothetical protein SCHPADRAFT_898395 [Schizopora paradoxa]|uniref:Uncharacterized protein n=1 Tax=Schizopora paradoxa TaxID=27342 RepID=A0A0H2S6E9_9AGAM|nr:hypothetical protein SCHPADRAFT_898395 [Schizopora paradoxa]